MQWDVFQDVIDDMDILSHYYLIDQNDSTIMHSSLDTKYLKQVYSIS
jgi:hypothetical protein